MTLCPAVQTCTRRPSVALFAMAQSIPTWSVAASRLVAVAAGREPADLVIRNGTWVNVHTREALDNHDLAIINGRFAYCGPDASHCIGEDTQEIEADGMYMIPGL